jgi:hypothetical protein
LGALVLRSFNEIFPINRNLNDTQYKKIDPF